MCLLVIFASLIIPQIILTIGVELSSAELQIMIGISISGVVIYMQLKHSCFNQSGCNKGTKPKATEDKLFQFTDVKLAIINMEYN